MSNKGFRPSSRQQKTRQIKRNLNRFDKGMIKDIDPIELPVGSVYHLQNAMGFRDSVKGRKGTELFAERKLPSIKTNVIASISNGVVTIPDGLTKDFVTKILVDNDNYRSFGLKEVVEDSSILGTDRYTTFLISDDEVEYTNYSFDIRGTLNATYYDINEKRLVIFIGNELYITNIKKSNTDIPRYTMSEWEKIYRSGDDEPFDSSSSFQLVGETLFLINSKGIFRINIDDKNNELYYWKTNGVSPSIDNKIKEKHRVNIWQYNYRYIMTFSRLQNSGWKKDRTFGLDGVILEQESCPSIVVKDKSDFTTYTSIVPPSESNVVVGGVIDNSMQESNRWKSYGLNSFSVEITKVDGSTYSIPVFVDYTDVESFQDVVYRTQMAINQYSSNIGFSVTGYGKDGARFVLFSKQLTNDDSSFISGIIQTPESELPEDPSVPGSYIYDNTVYSAFKMTDTDDKEVYKNRRNVLENLSIYDEKEKTQYSNSFTHYSIYRTMDISANDDEYGNLTMLRTVNNPEQYVWVADVPMIKTFEGYIIETNKLVVSQQVIDVFDIGSDVSVVFGGVDYKFSIVDIGEDEYNGEKRYFYILDKDTADDIGDEHSNIICIIGSTYDNVFYASKIDDKVISTKSFIKKDIGKFLYWGDGTISIIKDVDDGGSAYTVDRLDKENTSCGMNPINRNFNDNISDEILLARARSFPLRTRFWKSLPSTSLGVVTPGFIILASRGFGNVYYGQTGNLYDIGYHHTMQQSNMIKDGITSLSNIAKTVSVKTNGSTYAFLPTRNYQAGNPKFNESFFMLQDPELINEHIGTAQDSHCVRIDSNNELVFTNEPAIRFFNGSEYSDNVSESVIQNKYITKFFKKLILHYNGNMGVYLWGYNEDLDDDS